MADTAERTFRLLSLLQRRRYWAGPELARSLDVSARTLRRDIERLRLLGYVIEADRGSDGGYRLGSTPDGALLLLDGEESVALAVALHASANGESPLAQATLGALTKVLSMLAPKQRRRAEKVIAATAPDLMREQTVPTLEVLEPLAVACREHLRLRFDYVAADGRDSSRSVEPCQLVHVGSRWYLVAFDSDRSAWRTFRVDRMSDPVASKNSFTPRRPPARNLNDFVRQNMSELDPRYQVVIEVDAAASVIAGRYSTWADVEPIGDGRCRVTMATDSFRWPTFLLTELDCECEVIGPPEFKEHLAAVTARLGASMS